MRRFGPKAIILYLGASCCVALMFALVYYKSMSNNELHGEVHVVAPQKSTVNFNGNFKDTGQDEARESSSLQSKVKLDISDHQLLPSEHHDIDVRGKFQQQQIDHFCQQKFMAEERKYPEGQDLDSFHRHLMFDDRHKVIFCFIPKVGCTNLKRLMLYMGDHLPLETIEWPWVEDSIYLEPALKHASFLNNTLTVEERQQRIKDYYKFIFVRNPLERLVSGYRNKLEKPVRYDKQHSFPESVKIEILKTYRKEEVKYWQLTYEKSPFNISVTFREFIRFIVGNSLPQVNEHFQPMLHICHPCLIRYDFYGNFRNISHDVKALIEKFKTDPKYYRDESLHSSQEQTSSVMANYYKQLSQRDKVQLLSVWYDEILFYYTLYPSERDSHKILLNIDTPILN